MEFFNIVVNDLNAEEMCSFKSGARCNRIRGKWNTVYHRSTLHINLKQQQTDTFIATLFRSEVFIS